MAIITYWNDGKVETGQTMTIAAVASAIALNYNFKVLMINTKYNDGSLQYAFEQKNTVNSIFSKGKMDLDTGLSGMIKAISSNKTSPEIITNYTKIIWKNLELLTEKNISKEDYEKQKQYVKEIIKLANKYYDIVLVDLEGEIESINIKQILNISNINVVTLTQNINVLDRFKKTKEQNSVLNENDLFVSIGKFDDKSKYTVKNISKYIGEKNVFEMPYNTVFSMEAPEGKVADFIVNFRRAKNPHPNAALIASVNKQAEQIINTIKEQQRKIY